MSERRAGLAHVVSRIAQALFVVWAATTLAFVLLRLAPGDPYLTRFEGFEVSEAQRDVWRANRAYDGTMTEQYVLFLRNSASGDLGFSTMQQRRVSEVLRDVLPNTLLLMGLALGSSVLFGMAIGTWQGTRGDSTADQAVSTASLVAYSMPEFWLALLMLQLFALKLNWLPAGGAVSADHDLLGASLQIKDRLRHLVLPWLTLTIVGTAVFARFQRSAVRDTWNEPFVRTARAKGLAEPAVRQHAWRAALSPMITLVGLSLPALLGGAVFVERIFSWPGMGDATIQAVEARDYEFVTAAVIVGSVLTVTGSLLADWLSQLADPRTRS